MSKNLDLLDIPYKVSSKLVRGLDYYTQTVFEFTTNLLGAKNAVLAGGRYNNLIGSISGIDMHGVGCAAGIERIVELMKLNGMTKERKERLFFLIPIGAQAEEEAIKLAYQLRASGLQICVEFGNKIKKNMKKANKLRAFAAIIFGEDELQAGQYKLKEMQTSEEQFVKKEDLMALLKNMSAGCNF